MILFLMKDIFLLLHLRNFFLQLLRLFFDSYFNIYHRYIVTVEHYFLGFIFLVQTKGICGAVWFDFEAKSHLNRKIKNHAVWFGSVDF